MCGHEIIPRICISAVAEQIAPLHLHPVDFPLSLIISLLLLSAFFYYPLFFIISFFLLSAFFLTLKYWQRRGICRIRTSVPWIGLNHVEVTL